MTAARAGGWWKATWRPLKPPQLLPYIPTLPLLQGRAASQASRWRQSSCSCARYSSWYTPSESPEPRRSALTTTYLGRAALVTSNYAVTKL